ncbi:MAG: hypothetical protein ACHREM_09075 [Polyangiales bacterium]
MHHVSIDGAVGLCGAVVGSLFAEGEETFDMIERTAIGPVIPPAWRRRKAPEGFCAGCFSRVEPFERAELEHSVTSVLGPRPTHFETEGTALQKRPGDDPRNKGW